MKCKHLFRLHIYVVCKGEKSTLRNYIKTLSCGFLETMHVLEINFETVGFLQFQLDIAINLEQKNVLVFLGTKLWFGTFLTIILMVFGNFNA